LRPDDKHIGFVVANADVVILVVAPIGVDPLDHRLHGEFPLACSEAADVGDVLDSTIAVGLVDALNLKTSSHDWPFQSGPERLDATRV